MYTGLNIVANVSPKPLKNPSPEPSPGSVNFGDGPGVFATGALAAEIAEATAFYVTLARIGGPGLVGNATALPEGLYVDPKVYG